MYICLYCSPDGKETRLSADVAQIGAVEIVRQLDNGFVVDLAVLGYFQRMNLENLQSKETTLHVIYIWKRSSCYISFNILTVPARWAKEFQFYDPNDRDAEAQDPVYRVDWWP